MKKFRATKIVKQKKKKIINLIIYFDDEIMFFDDNIFRKNEFEIKSKRYISYSSFYIDNENVEKK